MFRALILVILVSGSCALTTAQDSQAERLVREGVEFTSAGQFAQAIRAFEEAIKLEPDSGAAYAALGRAYFKMREWRRAAAYLRRAAALNAQQKHAKNSLPVSEVAVVEPVRPTAQPA
ncbi:MAG TPA: tetratricopeptide repeat protein, partial [Pyrinomonadaceae bacterium]